MTNIPLKLLFGTSSESELHALSALFQQSHYTLTALRVTTPAALHAALTEGGWDGIVLCDDVVDLAPTTVLDLLRAEQAFDLPSIVLLSEYSEAAAAACMDAGARDCLPRAQPARLVPAFKREHSHKVGHTVVRASEERFRLLAEHALDVIYRYRLTAPPGFDYVSPVILHMTGYSAAELYADPNLGLNLVVPGDWAMIEAALHQPDEFNTRPFHIRWRRKDGQVIHTEHRISFIRDEHGQVQVIEGIARDVTEHWAAQEAERQATQRFTDLVNALEGIVWEADVASWRTTFVSAYAERLLGYSMDEWVADSDFWAQHIHPDDREAAVQASLRAAATHTDHEFEYRMIARDGREIWMRDIVKVSTRLDGTLVLRGIMLDITAQKRATNSLRHSRALLERRAEEIEGLYRISLQWSTTLDTHALLEGIVMRSAELLHAQAAALHLFDGPQHELVLAVATPILAPYVGWRIQWGEGMISRVMRAQHPLFMPNYLEWPGHRPELAEVMRARDIGPAMLVVPMMAKESAIGVIVFISAASTVDAHTVQLAELFGAQAAAALERTRLYEEVQRHADELAALNAATRAVSSSLDTQAVLAQLIEAVRTLVDAEGASALLVEGAELVFAAASGPNSAGLLGLRLPATAGVAGWVLAHGEPLIVPDVQADPRFYRDVDASTGSVTQQLVAAPILVHGVASGVVEAVNKRVGKFTTRDLDMISDLASSAAIALENANLYQRERAQRELLQQSQARLVHTEKMAALGRLLASITHEINNPLQAVIGWLDLGVESLDDGVAPTTLRKYFVSAAEEMERVGALLQRLRDFYRPARAERQQADINGLLESVLILTSKHLQQSHVHIERIWDTTVPTLSVDTHQLRQVFLNLVLNAGDALAETGGVLTTCTACDQFPLGHGRDDVPAVRIDFGDTAGGISQEILGHLFEPFVTSKKSGSGLGLYISYNLVKAMQGELTVVNHPGHGATFSVFLPIESGL